MEQKHTIDLLSLDDKIYPFYKKNNIAIGLFSSDEYAPYCGILIQSIIKNSTQDNNYDILILERNISDYNKKCIIELAETHINISIRFINVADISKILNVIPRAHFTLDNVIKIFFFSKVFEAYDKILTTDSDLVFMRDCAELYNIDIGNNYIAAVQDIIMQLLVVNDATALGDMKGLPASEYILNILNLRSTDRYLNTGVCLLNLSINKQVNKFGDLLELVNRHNYWFLEQDALNKCFADSSMILDSRWNVHAAQKFEEIKDVLSEEITRQLKRDIMDPYVMHYPGNRKPWNTRNLKYSDMFFKFARSTPWYEYIILNLSNSNNIPVNKKIGVIEKNLLEIEKQIYLKSWLICIKSFVKFILFKFISEGRFKQIKRAMLDENIVKYRHASQKQIQENIKKSKIHNSSAYRNLLEIKKLRNIHKGKRCFVVGLGPSLKIEDLEKLKNEITFSLNSVYRIFENTSWRPTYYVNNDIALQHGEAEDRLQELKNILKEYEFKGVFLATSQYNELFRSMVPKNESVYFVNSIPDIYQIYRPKHFRFSDDISKKVYMHGTTMFVISQIAYYMGFSEIYFIGTDANYDSKTPHVYEATDADKRLYGPIKLARQSTNSVRNGFNAINYHLVQKRNINVYNATRGGQLEVFPRVDFDKLLQCNYAEESLIIEVSVIIPIYNSAPYLKRCIDSILAQTFASIEIIAVDNGSTDRTPSILQYYAKRYPNKFRTITIEHRNYAGAGRNIGVQYAKGKYIVFSDSDDEMLPYAIEELYRKAIETDSEVVFSPHFRERMKRRQLLRVYKGNPNQLSVYDILINMEPAPWGKIFSKEFIDRIGPMPENFCFEDLAWFLCYGTYIKKAAYITRPCYIYHLRGDSQVNNSTSDRILDTIKAEKYALDNCNVEYKKIVEYHIAIRIRMNMMCRSYFYKEWLNYLAEMWDDLSKNPYLIKNKELYDFLNSKINKNNMKVVE